MKKYIKKMLIMAFVMAMVVVDIPFINGKEGVRAASFPEYRVVLDAGHDSSHSGAGSSGYREEILTYKIAAYCKAELERYGGIKVYMVRDGYDCPYGGSSVNSKQCNAKRVDFSKNHNADVYVSFHLNSAGASARGASVYYPNSSYRPELSKKGRVLATDILNQLKNVGISQNGRGTLIRNSEDNTRYPDGSLADYLAVIKGNKLNNIPAVLIEHCFISNANDRASFLSSEGKLKTLGVADANGIAEYLGIKGVSVSKAADGHWYYYKNGTIDYSYTGMASNVYGWWYIRNGRVDFSANTIVKYRGVWCYVKGGKYDSVFTGMAQNQNGYWYVKNGLVDFGYTGLASCNSTQNYNDKNYTYAGWYYFIKGRYDSNAETVAYINNHWWYVHKGMIDFTANTVAHNSYGWWYIKDGKVDFSFNGIARNSYGDWYIKNGKVDFDFTGLHMINNQSQLVNSSTGEFVNFDGLYYFENGKVNTTSKTVAYDGSKWVYVANGAVNSSYTGMASNKYGTWLVQNGQVNFDFNGLYTDESGISWYIEKSKVVSTYNGIKDINSIVYDSVTGETSNINGQYYFIDGRINKSEDIVRYRKTWVYVKDGQIDKNANTVAHNSNGWWYIKDGRVDFSFNGIARNQYGDWYIKDGMVQFGINDIVYCDNKTQYYPNVSDAEPFEFNGWYYVKNGQVQYGSETIQHNKNGWWYINNAGMVDFSYNGVASNSYGIWYVENGKVTFKYNGTVTVEGKRFNVKFSKVQM